MKYLSLISVMLLVVFTSGKVVAGSQQSSPPQHHPEDIISFAKQVERFAANNKARAFIISRLGRPADSLPTGIEFTHTAIAIYSQVTLADGHSAKGYAIYNLYQQANNANRSELMMDFPVDFFWGVHELKAGIMIPTPEVQTRLIQAIQQGYNEKLHNPNYSLISNPNNNKYQNCTEHTLNIINAAIYQTDDMAAIKASVRAHFRGHRLKTSPLKLALGNLFLDGVRTSDHGRKKYVTTYTSIGKYLAENQLLSSMDTIRFQAPMTKTRD